MRVNLSKAYHVTLRPKAGRNIELPFTFKPSLEDVQCAVALQIAETKHELANYEPSEDDEYEEYTQADDLEKSVEDGEIALQFLLHVDPSLFDAEKDFDLSVKIAGVTIGSIRMTSEPIFSR